MTSSSGWRPTNGASRDSGNCQAWFGSNAVAASPSSRAPRRVRARCGGSLWQGEHVPQLRLGHAHPLALVAAELELLDLLLGTVPGAAHVLVGIDHLQADVVAVLHRLPEIDVLHHVVLLVEADRALGGIDLQVVEGVHEG